VDVGDKIRLGRVLALKQGGEFTVGKPYLENVAVEAEVLEELRGPKVRLRGCVQGSGWTT
jgi:ribosomal protein L21